MQSCSLLLTRVFYGALIAFIGASGVPAWGQPIHENVKLVADDAAASDNFGNAVGISGSAAIIGAEQDSFAGFFAGSAYLFDTSTGEQLFKLVGSDTVEFDFFGGSVAISGTTAIVGASASSGNAEFSGSAYLFDTTTGLELFKPTASDASANDAFGSAVAISGTIAIIGAPGNDGTGSAYLFDTQTGVQLFKLNASDAADGDFFGISVDISGSIAIVGAYSDDDAGDSSGSAYLFDTATGAQLFKLTASDAAAGDLFGISVGVSGSNAIVGAQGDDDMGNSSGSAYLFDTATGKEVFKLSADDGAPLDQFGISVSISETTAIVGSVGDDDAAENSGSAYLFDTASGQQLEKLTASDAGFFDSFGISVSISDSSVIVGAYLDSDAGDFSGSAYLFNDADRDGLPDRWENGGIPYIDGNGVEQHFMLPGANRLHKDLYVEVDEMDGISLSNAAIALLEAAFADAQQTNPDGIDGISLHVLKDEGNLPHVQNWQTDGCWPLDFDAVRSSWYGTLAQRESSDSVALLAAKAKAYRYCVVADRAAPNSIGGCGQRPGDNFVIFPGTSYTVEQQAAVFMHALGHNLGLQHGGGDEINGKPNYPSIMNYVMSYRYSWNNSFWRLDYSRHDAGGFVSLDESSLDETAGIGTPGGFYDGFLMPYGASVDDGTGSLVRVVRYAGLGGGGVDFGNPLPNGLLDEILDTNAQQDLNYVTSAPNVPSGIPSLPSIGQTLTPYDDWAHVSLRLAAAMGSNAPAPSFPTDELTTDGRDWIEANFSVPPGMCLADLNGDGSLNFFDVSAFLTAFAAQDPVADFTGDGAFNFFDVSAFLTAFAGGCP